MKATTPTAPTSPNETDAHTVYELGLVKKSIPCFDWNTATGQEALAHLSTSLHNARIQKIRDRIAALNLEQCEADPSDLRCEQATSELRMIEILFSDKTLRTLERKDPLGFALKALERWLDIAETEQYRRAVDTGNIFISKQTRTGKLGPIASRIKKYMETHSQATALEVWNALARRPGKNFVYCDNAQGRYIEDAKTGVTKMASGRFNNLISQHRPKKK